MCIRDRIYTYLIVAVSDEAAPMSTYICCPLLAPHMVGITCPVFVLKKIENEAIKLVSNPQN